MKAQPKIVLLITVWALVFITGFYTFTHFPEVPDNLTCSMYHPEQVFDLWWEKNAEKYPGISKEQFKAYPFSNGLVTARTTKWVEPSDIQVGDVIIYYRESGNINIAHRVTHISTRNRTIYYRAQGDNTNYWEEFPQERIRWKLKEIPFAKYLERDGCRNKFDPT